ncbi:MAG: hypothetical protein A4S17_01410 [Proteobacteria bacterium HN_bin10]|nr:MAG: hypothetical protein A4S17_01410 [Proteobacteria bacterium HN_bin10]
MKILAMDTATTRLSVALLDDGEVLGLVDDAAPGAHGRLLVPAIDRVLGAAKLALGELDGLAVSIGPGSFTGLRVGLATVMGFRLAAGLPIVAVPTLEALAWNVRGTRETVCPLLIARSHDVYWALYRWEGNTVATVEPAQVGPVATLPERLPASILPVGEGWVRHRDLLAPLFERQGIRCAEAEASAMTASAVSVGLAGLERLRRGDLAGPSLAPLYVQRPEAEVKRAEAAKATR